MDEINKERMRVKGLIDMSIMACRRNNPGSRIALYLDSSMVEPVTGCWLPVMNIEYEGVYAPFVPAICEQVAEWFGSSYGDAQAKVGQVNGELGYSHQEVMRMVGDSMLISSELAGWAD